MSNYPFEPGQQPYGAYQAENSDVPPPPPPPPYPGSNLPLYQQAADPYAPTVINPYVPPPPVRPRGSYNKTPLAAIITIVVLVIAIVSIVGLLIARNITRTVTPPAPTPVPYPSLATAYSGLAHNITYNQNADMTMTSVVQNAGKINGNIQFGLPLLGSGTFNGTVSRTDAVQFVVSSGNAGGSLASTFVGTIDKQGLMSGTYSISNGQKGTWKASPASSPVVYPLLFANYNGNFYNNSTTKTGTMTLSIITQDQKNFTGMFDGSISVNGTVGTDNSIQFVATDSNGEPITFNGTVNIDSSLNGTYKTSSGVMGTWKVTPTAK